MRNLLLSAALLYSFNFSNTFADDCQKNLGDLIIEKLPLEELMKQAEQLNATTRNGEYIACIKQDGSNVRYTLHQDAKKVDKKLSDEEKEITQKWLESVKDRLKGEVLYKINDEEKKASVYKVDADNVCAQIGPAVDKEKINIIELTQADDAPKEPNTPKEPEAPKTPEVPKEPASASQPMTADASSSPGK